MILVRGKGSGQKKKKWEIRRLSLEWTLEQDAEQVNLQVRILPLLGA